MLTRLRRQDTLITLRADSFVLLPASRYAMLLRFHAIDIHALRCCLPPAAAII